MGKTIINHSIFDGLYNPFMVIWGMVYDIVFPTLNTLSTLVSDSGTGHSSYQVRGFEVRKKM